MHRGIIAYVIVIIIMIILIYLYTGFRLPHFVPTTSTTTIPANQSSHTTATTTTSNYTYIYPCNNFQIFGMNPNSNESGLCSWKGGMLGVWLAGGNYGAHATIIGANNVTYLNATAPYSCISFFDNFSAPAQYYRVSLKTGNATGSCGYSTIKLNMTTVPPMKIYSNVYNGAFANGKYLGWNVTGKGFGTAPFNITASIASMCYLGKPWSNYNGTFFATTYNCGLSNAQGNLTSSPFIVNMSDPFLNFRIISQADNQLYVEILENNTPMIITHYNTFNISSGGNASSTFQNASIPMASLIGKVVRIRVVAQTTHLQRYIAVGDFSMAPKPISTPGILVNMTINQA
ncbi:MAG: hypothetical protein QXW10_02180 [Candidatus Micrarchaeaceae archaeon]